MLELMANGWGCGAYAGTLELMASSWLISDLRLEMSEMDQLMLDVANSNSSNPIEDIACKWIRSTDRWREWIPVVTNCGPGFGFANDEGEHVLTRADATGCSLCQPGSWSELYSDGDGVSHRCIQCSQGTFQNEAGELKCAKCAPGSVSSTTGAVECELCTVGRYANSSGMTECTACDPRNPELTTIHEVDLDGRVERLQFKGASSAEFCTCPASSFLYKGKCESCQRGASCPGTGKITLNPGFWSAEEDPGSVFQCFDTPGRCPGGEPGMCALGRDTDSLACSLCLPGWYEQMGVCTECRSSDYVFIAGTMLVVTTALGVLHFTVLGTGGKNRRSSQSLIMTGLALSQMTFFLQAGSILEPLFRYR
ncbi:Ephb4 [Symbiodinium sp. CCMP2592]|nr:Ephb4 [Symbiodinium sp. CCMP2592]